MTEHSSDTGKFVSTVTFYAILFLVTFITIFVTAYNYPLFPLQMDSLIWSNQWLFSTTVDCYGALLCFSGVVLSTEVTWFRGIAWVAGFCLLGSPVCCVWILLWLWQGGGSLRLERRRDGYQL